MSAIREIYRVLRSGGQIAIRAGSAEQIADYPYVPFFPGTAAIFRRTPQSARPIKEQFEADRLTLSHHEVVESPVAANWQEFAYKISYRADSILIQLNGHVFSEGMQRLRAHAKQQSTSVPVVVPVSLLVFRKT